MIPYATAFLAGAAAGALLIALLVRLALYLDSRRAFHSKLKRSGGQS